MRYKAIDNKLFINNRKNFSNLLKKNSLAVFNSNDVMPTNADGTMPFRQNNDLFYLSGIDQEESILLIFPDAPDEKHREVLFLQENNEYIAVWEGDRLTKEQATQVSGVPTIYWLNDFEKVFNQLAAQAERIYLNTNEHLRADRTVETRDDRFIEWCKNTYPVHEYERAAPLMHKLRAIKSDIEIEVMQHACKITEKGFRRVMDFVKPGVKEYEIEAEIIREFVGSGSSGFAYTPIIASGANACVLHYTNNEAVCKEGDMILMDFGAEYANYASDMTRCVPVSGRYLERQKEVYNAVLRSMRKSLKMLVPGTKLNEYHREVGKIVEEELVGLGVLDKTDIKNQDPHNPAYKKYFMHGTSHYIGLDTHDVGDFNRPLEEGMAFTCEPGIYLRDEGIGVRLENDIIVTKNGPHDMMKDIPLETEEIEEIMNS